MPFTRLLIANRGEIAIRIARARGRRIWTPMPLLRRPRPADAMQSTGLRILREGRLRPPLREAGLIFVGPAPAHLELFGDKARARTAAVAAAVPVIRGMDRAVSLKEAQAFFSFLRGGATIIKAVAGGGGRGTRAVLSEAEIEPAY